MNAPRFLHCFSASNYLYWGALSIFFRFGLYTLFHLYMFRLVPDIILSSLSGPGVAILAFRGNQTTALYHNDVIMRAIASQITNLTIVYSTVYSDPDQRKHQSSASLDFVRGIHRGPVNSPHKWPVTRKMVPFDDVIMMLNASDTTRKSKW